MHAVTGHWFPFSVQASNAAWRHVESITDKAARQRELRRILPDARYPLKAEVIGSPRPAPEFSESPMWDPWLVVTVRVTNASAKPHLVAQCPRSAVWDVSSLGFGSWSVYPGHRTAAETHTTLGPGEWTEFDVPVSVWFLVTEPPTRQLELVYGADSERPDARTPSWMGRLPVELGALRKEDRTLKKVEERWPNGNLKAVGHKAYGQKLGQWEYFNEEGDRVRVEEVRPIQPTVSACDPNSPENKGAGKRPPDAAPDQESGPSAGNE